MIVDNIDHKMLQWRRLLGTQKVEKVSLLMFISLQYVLSPFWFPLFKQMDLIYSLIYTVRVVWLAITFEKEFYVLPPFQSHGPTFLFGCLK